MKKKTAPVQKKCFRFQFTPVVLLMSAAALLVCALGIALSVYNIFKSGLHSFTDFLKYPFLILISIALAVIVVALLIKSQYIVDDKNFSSHISTVPFFWRRSPRTEPGALFIFARKRIDQNYVNNLSDGPIYEIRYKIDHIHYITSATKSG